jgi:hypothetical protein
MPSKTKPVVQRDWSETQRMVVRGDGETADAGGIDGAFARAGAGGTALSGRAGVASVGRGGTATVAEPGVALVTADTGTAHQTGGRGIACCIHNGTAIADTVGIATSGEQAKAGDCGIASVYKTRTRGAEAGRGGIAVAWSGGDATAGDGGVAVAGTIRLLPNPQPPTPYTATAGQGGVAVAFHGGQVSAGEGGVIVIIEELANGDLKAHCAPVSAGSAYAPHVRYKLSNGTIIPA